MGGDICCLSPCRSGVVGIYGEERGFRVLPKECGCRDRGRYVGCGVLGIYSEIHRVYGLGSSIVVQNGSLSFRACRELEAAIFTQEARGAALGDTQLPNVYH